MKRPEYKDYTTKEQMIKMADDLMKYIDYLENGEKRNDNPGFVCISALMERKEDPQPLIKSETLSFDVTFVNNGNTSEISDQELVDSVYKRLKYIP